MWFDALTKVMFVAKPENAPALAKLATCTIQLA